MSNQFSRRRFLKTAAALALAHQFPRPSIALDERSKNRLLTVDRIDRTTVRVPFREIPQRAMDRELPHWRYAEIFEVHLSSGQTGIGETLLYYTWGVTQDDDVERVLGKNAADHMWDDSLGAGLQMALFDAVARTLEVPIHSLLGHQVNSKTPLSWWNIDTPPEDMAAECREALNQGYLAYKTKGRPWFDIWEQMRQSTAGVPPEFKIDMDFNDTLLTAEKGMSIMRDLEKYPQTDIFESPIPQGDVEGNKKICDAMRVKVAMHYGTPAPKIVISTGCCDGFVIGGGASRVMEQGRVAAMADMPFWLQLVGTGVTAAFSLQFGAVHTHATWPAVNCHQLYTHTLLTQPIVVDKGFAKVPETPGLGYDLDRDAVERFRVEKPAERPNPERLIETSWPDGRRMYFANGDVNFMLTAGMQAKIPYYERGVTSRLFPDDGSKEWREIYTRARKEPLLVSK